ncbi:MAG: hypothetical protein PUP90_16600 [Nostoc sp. S4]|nr:hypothetical protein [Nostoc sp. S4]
MTDQPLIQVEASPTFNRNLRTLANMIKPVFDNLPQSPVNNQPSTLPTHNMRT